MNPLDFRTKTSHLSIKQIACLVRRVHYSRRPKTIKQPKALSCKYALAWDPHAVPGGWEENKKAIDRNSPFVHSAIA
jgi:hypothetical protein